MDMSPPTLAADKAVFGRSDGAVSGSCADAGSGVALVEVSGDGGDNWIEAVPDDDEWSVALGDLPTGVAHVMVRASDEVGNMLMDHIMVEVDTAAPVITISLPEVGSEVSGAVVMLGSISDSHLASYIVEVQKDGDSTWTVVQPTQATTGVAGTLATWVTAGLSGGDYTLRVTATDAMGETSEATVDVLLKGAHLSIGPGDISFSDSHPLPGDKVTVLVTVRNDGDSPAEDVTVVVYDGDTELGRQTGVTVPAHGTAVVPMELKASGDHEITARATSDLYDTGGMTTGQPLRTIEEEATLENAGGILGLVALILAIFAILLAFLLNRKGGSSEPAMTPAPAGEVIVDPLAEPMPEQEPRFEPEPLPPPVPSQEFEVEQVNVQRPRT
jgi:hypothetical protein